MPYQRGDAVIFRGAEMEHFVSDWTGYRMFLLYTNHHPVRNYAYRVMGKLSPKSNDPHTEEKGKQDYGKEPKDGQEQDLEHSNSAETNSERYSPCWVEPAEQEPEELYETDIHGAGFLGRWGSSSGSGSGSRSRSESDYDKGELVVALPSAAVNETKRNDEDG